MCLGVPAKVIRIDGHTALVDFGGVRKEVLVAASGISPGDLVVVHAGMAIGKLSEEDFLENVALYRDIRAQELMEEGLDEGTAIEKATREMKEMLGSLGISIANAQSGQRGK
jgi:hydrogenase expression/formation protein HypC